VLPPAPGTDRGVAALRVAGLTLLRRLVLAATSAGYARVLVADGAGDPASLAGAMASGTAGLAASAAYRMVAVPANVVPQKKWLRALLEMPLERDALYADPALGVAVVETQRLDAVTAAVGGGEPGGDVLARLGKAFDRRPLPPDPAGAVAIREARDRRTAERWLYRSLIKQNEGFMSRHFERRLSLALTRRLAPTPVTPNAMTLTSAAIGLAGAPFFLSTWPPWQLVGALLFLAHSVLDGCDGELARLKFQQSRWGAVLDYWGDNVVHVAVFACIAVGWSLSVGAAWPLAVGVVAAAATLGSAALMFERTAEDRAAASSDAASRLIDALSNRDFIYVIVVLAAFGKAAWFLVAAAVGAPAFVLLVLWLDRRHGRLP
jgi:phosphatidylglycerophosphate synthase